MTRNIFVLSGGGSRGAAQIGMLRALLGAGIAPDVVVGASVGAINACTLATDPTLDQVERLADRWMRMRGRDLTGPKVAIVSNLARRRAALFSPNRLRDLVSEWLPVENLEDFKIPALVATTNLRTGLAAHHDHGNAIDLIAASAALPAVFPPVHLPGPDGSLDPHVDAGISENLPMAGALKVAEPGDTIWALDVTKRSGLRNLNHPLDVLIATIVAAVSNQPMAPVPDGVSLVECRLGKEFDSGPVFDFSHTGTLFRLGEQTALASLNALGRV